MLPESCRTLGSTAESKNIAQGNASRFPALARKAIDVSPLANLAPLFHEVNGPNCRISLHIHTARELFSESRPPVP